MSPLFEVKVGAWVYKDLKPRFNRVKKGEGLGSYPFSRVGFYKDYLVVKTPKIFGEYQWQEYKINYSNIESFQRRLLYRGILINHNQEDIPKHVLLRDLGFEKKLNSQLKEIIGSLGLSMKFLG